MLTDKPIGIIITWSVAMLTEGGSSLHQFMKAFEAMNDPDGGVWFQKMAKRPKHDVLYCYIIIGTVPLCATASNQDKFIRFFESFGFKYVSDMDVNAYWNIITGDYLRLPNG